MADCFGLPEPTLVLCKPLRAHPAFESILNVPGVIHNAHSLAEDFRRARAPLNSSWSIPEQPKLAVRQWSPPDDPRRLRDICRAMCDAVGDVDACPDVVESAPPTAKPTVQATVQPTVRPTAKGPRDISRKTPPQRVRTPDASPRVGEKTRRLQLESRSRGCLRGRGACTTGKTLANQQPREGPSLEHTRGSSPHARSALPYMLGPRHTRTFQSSVQPEARRGCPPLVSAWA